MKVGHWNPDYIYRIRGVWASRQADEIIIFDLSEAIAAILCSSDTQSNKIKKRVVTFPEEWESEFGMEFYEYGINNRFRYLNSNSDWKADSKPKPIRGTTQFDIVSDIDLQAMILVHPEQRRLIIRPCDADTPDSLRWVSGGGNSDEKEAKNKDMTCRVFASKLFDLMKWNTEYRYKLLGKPAVCDKEVLFLFKLTDFEMYVSGTANKRLVPYYPEDWRDYFGTPVEKHEETYKIDLADGYTTGEKV